MQHLEFKRKASIHWPNVIGISLAASGLLMFWLSWPVAVPFLVCGIGVLLKSEFTRRRQKQVLADCQMLAEWNKVDSVPLLHVRIRLASPMQCRLRSWSVGLVAGYRVEELYPQCEFPGCHDEFAWVTTALERIKIVEVNAPFEIETSLLVPEHLGSATIDPEETIDWSMRVALRMDRLFEWIAYATIPAPPAAAA
jgi:hypothetical protein